MKLLILAMKPKLLIACVTLCCFLPSAMGAIDKERGDALFEVIKGLFGLIGPPVGLLEAVRKKVLIKGCPANVCFILDGSASVGDDFATQKDFVKIVTAIIGADDAAQFAGIVLSGEQISSLTDDVFSFLDATCDAGTPATPVSFISPGVRFCVNELDSSGKSSNPNRIVKLLDGFSNFGDLTGPGSPAGLVQQWINQDPDNDIGCIAVGFSSTRALEAITGDARKVLEVTDWPVLLNLLDSLIDQICFQPIAKDCPCNKCFAKSKKRSRNKAKARKICRRKKFKSCKLSSCGTGGFRCCI